MFLLKNNVLYDFKSIFSPGLDIKNTPDGRVAVQESPCIVHDLLETDLPEMQLLQLRARYELGDIEIEVSRFAMESIWNPQLIGTGPRGDLFSVNIELIARKVNHLFCINSTYRGLQKV